jgi:predicted HicB family RNase H-like nuclease
MSPIFPSDTNNGKALFTCLTPSEAWSSAHDIIRQISPSYDFHIAKMVFDDIVRLFHGEYVGFQEIRTPYHDLQHTLSVFICSIRLLHSLHLYENRLSDREITLVILASLMRDVGYAQLLDDDTGTGAQYTLNHIERGIEFMEEYIAEQGLPADFASPIRCMMQCTSPILPLSEVCFPDERTRFFGQLIGTANLAGPMADRTYLEKLMLLYLEYLEAGIGDYIDMHDLLNKTQQFYAQTQNKLHIELGGIYTRLAAHFRESFGTERNYYHESIEKNIAYLTKINASKKEERFGMLKRGGITKLFATQLALC